MTPKIYLLNDALKGIGKGRYPQVQKMSEGYDYRSPDSVQKLRPDMFADFKPNFNYPVLGDGFKATDLLSCAPFPYWVLMVSDKLLRVLTNFKLPPHKIYAIQILHKKKLVAGYNALHILDPEEQLNHIDFGKSIFWIEELDSHVKVERLQLKNMADLKSAAKKARDLKVTSKVRAEELVMREEFYKKVDLFSLSEVTFPVTYKVTERLKDAIEKEKCTGVAFQSLSDDKESLKDWLSKKILTTYFPQK
jgi:hypothetical protein